MSRTTRTRPGPRLRRGLAAIGMTLLLAATAAACGSDAEPEETPAGDASDSAAAETRTLTDQSGAEVTLPPEPKIAASIGAFAQSVALVGGEDQLVATIPDLSDMFHTVWPKANPDGHDSANVEEVIASGAEVIIGPEFTDEQKTQLTAAGVQPFVIDAFATVDEMQQVVTLIGDVVGGVAPERAAEFVEYYGDNIAFAEEKTSDIPEDERVKLLNLRFFEGAYSTVAGTDISADYAAAVGADFVSDEITDEGIASSVDAEQVIAWAPEVIFTMGQEARDKILNDPALATVPAVVNEKVYAEPVGTYPWSVRSAEGALMPLFLGTITYPDRFEDMSLADETRDFYQRFYGYSLTDEEVEQILSGELY